jgi:hypothetical protein
MANQNVTQSHNDAPCMAIVIMDAGRDPRDGMLQGRSVKVGTANSAREALGLAQTKFESSGPGAIGFTAERVSLSISA